VLHGARHGAGRDLRAQRRNRQEREHQAGADEVEPSNHVSSCAMPNGGPTTEIADGSRCNRLHGANIREGAAPESSAKTTRGAFSEGRRRENESRRRPGAGGSVL